MDWSGIQDDETDISDKGETSIRFLQNGSLLVNGEFSRRPGMGARIALSGIVCGEIAAYVVFVGSDGRIWSEAQ